MSPKITPRSARASCWTIAASTTLPATAGNTSDRAPPSKSATAATASLAAWGRTSDASQRNGSMLGVLSRGRELDAEIALGRAQPGAWRELEHERARPRGAVGAETIDREGAPGGCEP